MKLNILSFTNASRISNIKPRLPILPTISDLIKLYKLRALRQLSQNFIMDTKIANRLVKCAGSVKGGEVCEIGCGPGNLTRAIINKEPSRIIGIEKDTRFTPMLELLTEASPCPLEIIYEDILSLQLTNIFSKSYKKDWTDSPPNLHIIGNLPFNVATPLIIKWMQSISKRENAWVYGRVPLTLTFQKEVAERMISPILTKTRGRLSIICQNWCQVEYKLTIKGSSFLPKPEVDVGVIKFTPLVKPIIDLPYEIIDKVINALFNSRQKYCVRGVELLFPKAVSENLSLKILNNSEIPTTTRPLQLTLNEIGRICQAYIDIINEYPLYAKYNFRRGKDFNISLLEN